MYKREVEDYGRAARLGLMFGLGVVLIVCSSYLLQGCGGGDDTLEGEDPQTVTCAGGFICADPGFVGALQRCCEKPCDVSDTDELRRVIAGLRDRLRQTEESLRVAEDAFGTCEGESVRWRERFFSLRESSRNRMYHYRECRQALVDCTDQLPPEGSCCVAPGENYGEACHSQRPDGE